ncbi:hypothetical protein O3P69_000448 [Scylla paramamosain]|uniref:Uncharacterized protein n=1 Tax=Scylla paramamosain TaxID=85552 RepID=A0AAW0UVV8_SCYPA
MLAGLHYHHHHHHHHHILLFLNSDVRKSRETKHRGQDVRAHSTHSLCRVASEEQAMYIVLRRGLKCVRQNIQRYVGLIQYCVEVRQECALKDEGKLGVFVRVLWQHLSCSSALRQQQGGQEFRDAIPETGDVALCCAVFVLVAKRPRYLPHAQTRRDHDGLSKSQINVSGGELGRH